MAASSAIHRGTTPALANLQRLIRRPLAAAKAERCELCSLPIPAEHAHLLEAKTRRLLCACEACAVLFDRSDGTLYRRLPRVIRRLPDFRLTDLQWDDLLIPINLAFFFSTAPDGNVVAQYPSPAGAMESLLPLHAWDNIVGDNPILAALEPDVEALLVNRLNPAASKCFVVPIDQCYGLVGVVRADWRGLSGGVAMWKEIGTFFDQLERMSPSDA